MPGRHSNKFVPVDLAQNVAASTQRVEAVMSGSKFSAVSVCSKDFVSVDHVQNLAHHQPTQQVEASITMGAIPYSAVPSSGL